VQIAINIVVNKLLCEDQDTLIEQSLTTLFLIVDYNNFIECISKFTQKTI